MPSRDLAGTDLAQRQVVAHIGEIRPCRGHVVITGLTDRDNESIYSYYRKRRRPVDSCRTTNSHRSVGVEFRLRRVGGGIASGLAGEEVLGEGGTGEFLAHPAGEVQQ